MADTNRVAVIVDNRCQSVEDVLNAVCEDSDPAFDIVSAYFSLSGYITLKQLLDSCTTVRFMYGDPSKLRTASLMESPSLSFFIGDDQGLEPRQALIQSSEAKQCYDWISNDSVEIHKLQERFLHGKYYCLRAPTTNDYLLTLIGSSNFTQRGITHSSMSGNYETNHKVRNLDEQRVWHEWFEEWWKRSVCVKDVVKRQLERVFQPHSARMIYYKTLYEIFKDRISLDGDQATTEILAKTPLVDSVLWKQLYQFQKDAAIHIIGRFQRESGIILADSTGLGKTLTALAVIAWFCQKGGSVLLLCPKRLENNWLPYSRPGAEGNPFGQHEQGIPFRIAAHTDLTRDSGRSVSGIDLSNWNAEHYSLIVIDESHAFRNLDTKSYARLADIVSRGVDLKVLLLSATPVNTSLQDLLAQVLLMNNMKSDTYRETLGIQDVSVTLRNADKIIREYVQRGHAWENDLSDLIGDECVQLITHTTIARSRNHIEKHYTNDLNQIGGKFPCRKKPKELYPKIDLDDETDFSAICEDLLQDWNVYQPEKFLVDRDQDTSDEHLSSFSHLMRSGLVKRLESCCFALHRSIERMITKASDRIKWCRGELEEIEGDDEVEEGFEDGENPEPDLKLSVWKYQRSEIDCDTYVKALSEDIKKLQKIDNQLTKILNHNRDGKLKKLIAELKARPKHTKTVVFTAFAETATYLYDSLKVLTDNGKLPRIALITGSTERDSGDETAKRDTILRRFAPAGQGTIGAFELEGETAIDVLISTDCMSEGQNLQDADLVIHYDIHWNPVRIVQRLGRIDRLQTTHENVHQTMFWPTKDIEEYLRLKRRIDARKTLVSQTGGTETFDETITELDKRREEDIKKLRNDSLTLDELSETKSLSNLSMHDFIEELFAWLKENRDILDSIPLGTVAAVSGEGSSKEPEVVFCLKGRSEQRQDKNEATHSPLYRVIALKMSEHVQAVRHDQKSFREALTLMRSMQETNPTIDNEAQDELARQLVEANSLKIYNEMLSKALEWAKNSVEEDVSSTGAWELVSWMVCGPRSRTELENKDGITVDPWML